MIVADRGNGGIEARAVRFAGRANPNSIAGYFTEYSGGKQAAFMLTDFAEVVLVAVLVTLFFFGGWQFPWLYHGRLPFSRAVHSFALRRHRGRHPRSPRVLGQGGIILLAADPDALDAAAVPLRPVDASWMERPGAARPDSMCWSRPCVVVLARSGR